MKTSNKNFFVYQFRSRPLIPLLTAILAVALIPRTGQACACGCGIFEVGDLSMFPEGLGAMAFLEYDYQDQNRNWAGDSSAPAANNDDKKIETDFFTLGMQYLFNRSWGVQVEVPFDYRTFATTSDVTGKVVKFHWGAFGDMRLEGIYTGFAPDQSVGVTFGVKVPTGDFRHNDYNQDIDRDSEIGTGSTDLLLGSFFHHKLTSDDNWRFFLQAKMDLPVFSQDGYRPGLEIDGAAGVYYNGWSIKRVQIKPLAQVINSFRTSDSGVNASHPVASGYERIVLSPGIEIDTRPVMVNATVDLPVYQRMTGNQLVAAALVKVVVSYRF